jgi:hypothetical protein
MVHAISSERQTCDVIANHVREQCRCAQLALQATILQARSGKLCFTFARALTGSGSNCNCNKKTLNIASLADAGCAAPCGRTLSS